MPSPHMPYSIVNVLYGYAYVARLHNGSHGDTPLQTMKVSARNFNRLFVTKRVAKDKTMFFILFKKSGFIFTFHTSLHQKVNPP